MLAELYDLAGSLERFGLATPQVHPWVKPLSKGVFLIANLDSVGAIRIVEIRGEADGASIPKVKKDNQNAFPTFKLAYPLLDVAADAELRIALKPKTLSDAKRAALLREAMAPQRPASAEKNIDGLGQLIRFTAEIKGLLWPVLPECPALARLMDVLLNCSPEPDSFLRSLTEAVLAALERGEDTKTAQTILIGDLNKSGKVEGKELPLVLDSFREAGDEFMRVAHPKMAFVYSKALLKGGNGEADGVCSITGERTALEHSILPSPGLPALADAILFSSNSKTPCLQRYDLTGSGIFPIGRKTAQKLNSTALWITAPERKGKTWSLVPRSDDSGRDLVLTYVDLHPDLNAQLAELFSESDELGRAGVFESKAATVLKAIDRLQGKLATGAFLHTLVLRRISKGQVQVEVTRQYRVERLREALGEWAEACANVPRLSVMVPTGKGSPAAVVGPRALFPGQVVEATKWIWIRGGAERQPTAGVPLATVYDLYLAEGSMATAAAVSVLERVLQQCSPLLLLLGDQLTRFGRSVRDLTVPARNGSVTAVTLLGIALYKLEHKKESYMKETAFSLGRLLALSDVLHAQYCRVVRDGQLPPQLLGNQHYAMATEHPSRACEVLGQRLRIYKGWADTARAKNDEQQAAVRYAKWAVKEMGTVAAVMHGNLPERGFDDMGKAEMLLGYLAREKETEGTNE